MEPVTKRHVFHRHLACLCSSERLWQNVSYVEGGDDSNKRRFVTLYRANGALGAIHPLGLILDQEESTDMHHTFIHDTDITMNSRQMWLALKMILDGFVRMIDQSKVLAVKEDSCDEEQ